MVVDSRHREELLKLRKNFHNREKTFRIKKKILEYIKIFQSLKKKKKNLKNLKARKIFQNREKKFRIEKKSFYNIFA